MKKILLYNIAWLFVTVQAGEFTSNTPVQAGSQPNATCSSFSGNNKVGGQCQQCTANGCYWDIEAHECADSDGSQSWKREMDIADFFQRSERCTDTLNVCSVELQSSATNPTTIEAQTYYQQY